MRVWKERFAFDIEEGMYVTKFQNFFSVHDAEMDGAEIFRIRSDGKICFLEKGYVAQVLDDNIRIRRIK